MGVATAIFASCRLVKRENGDSVLIRSDPPPPPRGPACPSCTRRSRSALAVLALAAARVAIFAVWVAACMVHLVAGHALMPGA